MDQERVRLAVAPVNVRGAEALARTLHAGQVDKLGEDYASGHLARVSHQVEALSSRPSLQAAAWLHDALEDTDATEETLRDAGIADDVVALVAAVTRRVDESYESYIGRVARSGADARLLKRADLLDNLRPDRVAALEKAAPDFARSRLRRYESAVATLDRVEAKKRDRGERAVGDGRPSGPRVQ